jgi:hypothetical protein
VLAGCDAALGSGDSRLPTGDAATCSDPNDREGGVSAPDPPSHVAVDAVVTETPPDPTAATLLLSQGVPARVVMEMLGHSQIGLTMNPYSHVSLTMLGEAARSMESALWGNVGQELNHRIISQSVAGQ